MSDTQSAASNRITSLLDANSFVEIGAQVSARSTSFNLSSKAVPGDGVITGYGTIDGALVYVYSQDMASMGGSVGEMHAKKITRLYRMARQMGAPVIGMIDSKGIRLEESTDALASLGAIYRAQAMTSGLVPQITAIYNCGGGLSLIPAMSDFVFMENEGKLFVNAPDTIKDNSADKLDNRTSAYQTKAGHVDFVGSEAEIADAIRILIGLLPCNDEDEGEIVASDDDLNRSTAGFAALEAADQIACIADNGLFFETKRGYADCIRTGFIRLNGATVGVVANADDTLRFKAVDKAASFVSFCDAFNIPVLTLASATEFCHCECTEQQLPDAAARFAFSYASATVPKVTVVKGNLYGTPYVLMGSKSLGADYVYALENVEIGAMEAKSAAKILAADGDAKAVRECADAYRTLQLGADSAASRGYVDTVISDADVRKYVIGAFEMLYTKREERPEKKHGTI